MNKVKGILTVEDLNMISNNLEGRFVEHKDIRNIGREIGREVYDQLRPELNQINNELKKGDRRFSEIECRVKKIEQRCAQRNVMYPDRNMNAFHDQDNQFSNVDENRNVGNIKKTWKEITAWVIGGITFISAIIASISYLILQYV